MNLSVSSPTPRPTVPSGPRAATSTAVLIPTARPTFDIATATAYADAATALLRDLGADVVRPDGLVMDGAQIPAAKALLDDHTGLDVHVCASFADAGPALELYRGLGRPVLLWAFREPGAVGDRLLLNSLCGANLVAHALVRSGVDVRLCYGNPDDPGVRSVLAAALDGELPALPVLPGSVGTRARRDVAVAALDHLRGQRIGVLGEPPTGFTPSEFDAEVLRRLFGLDVEPLQLDEMFARIEQVSRPDREVELAAAMEWQPSLADLESSVLDTFAAVTIALREWHSDDRLAALSIRCWPEFPTELGVCPCSAL